MALPDEDWILISCLIHKQVYIYIYLSLKLKLSLSPEVCSSADVGSSSLAAQVGDASSKQYKYIWTFGENLSRKLRKVYQFEPRGKKERERETDIFFWFHPKVASCVMITPHLLSCVSRWSRWASCTALSPQFDLNNPKQLSTNSYSYQYYYNNYCTTITNTNMLRSCDRHCPQQKLTLYEYHRLSWAGPSYCFRESG